MLSPEPGGNAGGVERFCGLVGDVLRAEGWSVSEAGPSGTVGKWAFRFGGTPLVLSLRSGTAARAVAPPPDLIIGNGFLGLRAPHVPARIQVFHGTSAAETMAIRHGLRTYDWVRRYVSYTAVEATTCRAGLLAVVSDSAAEETVRHYRRRADAVIPNGVDTQLFRPRDRAEARAALGIAPERRLALYAGRIEYRKGGDLVAGAARAGGWDLAVAGATPVEGATNLGVLEPERLALAYAAADCLLFPTRYEACSFVILEAMASGLPVVTTRVGWMRTLLRDVPAYDALCIEPDPADVAARLRAFDPVAAARLAGAARDYVVTNNSLECFGADWRALIRRACGG